MLHLCIPRRRRLTHPAMLLARYDLPHRAQVAIEPIEHLFDTFVPRYVMTCIVDNAALVLSWRTQEAEHRLLRGLYRVEEIETAVQHQHWHPHPGREVELVHFRQ